MAVGRSRLHVVRTSLSARAYIPFLFVCLPEEFSISCHHRYSTPRPDVLVHWDRFYRDRFRLISQLFHLPSSEITFIIIAFPNNRLGFLACICCPGSCFGRHQDATLTLDGSDLTLWRVDVSLGHVVNVGPLDKNDKSVSLHVILFAFRVWSQRSRRQLERGVWAELTVIITQAHLASPLEPFESLLLSLGISANLSRSLPIQKFV